MNDSSSRALGFGICGLGMIADFHAQAIRAAKDQAALGSGARAPWIEALGPVALWREMPPVE